MEAFYIAFGQYLRNGLEQPRDNTFTTLHKLAFFVRDFWLPPQSR